MRRFVFAIFLVSACGDNKTQTLSAPPDELRAITYNMYYGLAANLLPEDSSVGSLSATARAIINATTLTDFRCRIAGAAQIIVAEKPDVIGIQEGLEVVFARDLKDRSDDDFLIDFLDELADDIQRAGGPRYDVFQRDNAVIQDTLPVFGGIRIADRGALLIDPRFGAKLIESRTFQTLESASDFVPGTNGVVVRGALHARAAFPSGAIDFFVTHLQSGGDGAVRAAQAQELGSWIQTSSAPGSTIVHMGDLNDIPNSPPYASISANLVDTYGLVGTPPGFTAYQPQTLDNATDESTMRYDYIFVRAGQVQESRVILNTKVQPCNLWPSDHFAVVSRFKTQ
jgi:endonuclease/exonuclease/phosphatase family metal-dependent hydrolase